ncbi:MAG: cytochrome c oxidase subunit 3 [Armatimonadota bacterium]|nr:cytochrome c oxidase subunit 3 [Armatimonadota bacterium]MDR7468317.1 cytochrome c oxidase subunit 3 [Armatimonadota bacterium]MDR7492620.1 cytochrome c oxidase subunit 3 [Armatimonadota bacterium]MDR7547452.1 cytochrome c oxidase subunit 3 [Armatimonadota bacterium]MDR7558855.1 cytochrome c oxidase subunit 3 [Armatimonadota bacterium]
MTGPASTLERPRRTPDLPIGPGGPSVATGDGGAAGQAPVGAALIAAWLLVAAITLLFAAFTATLLARRAEADWRGGPLPAVLWASTAVLLLSSGAMEWARAGGRRGRRDRLWAGLLLTLVLGVVFVGLQWTAWRQLVRIGVYMSTNPHSAFFYLLTGAHAVHVAGGLGWLAQALARTRRAASAAAAMAAVDPAAVYWHFLDVLWLYLFTILFAL